MGFWDWMCQKPDVIDNSDILLHEERTKNTLLQNHIDSLSVKISEAQVNLISKDNEITYLKGLLQSTNDDLKSRIIEYDNLENRSKITISNLNKQIENLEISLSVKPILPTLSQLPDYIKSLKGKDGYEDYNLWWEIQKATWIVFAKWQVSGYKETTAQGFKKMITDLLPGLIWHSEAKDGIYRIVSTDQVVKILSTSFVKHIPYIADIYDCDDFSDELRTFGKKFTLNSFTEVWGFWNNIYHSRNLIVCTDGILDVEPQNNKSGLYPAGIGDNFVIKEVHNW